VAQRVGRGNFSLPAHRLKSDYLSSHHHLDDFCSKTDFLDRAEVMRLIDQNNGPQVWYLLNFALWWKEYIV
jgi:asparagine synthase (glutamine-hydrolysing)